MNTLFAAIIVALLVWAVGLLIGSLIWGGSDNS